MRADWANSSETPTRLSETGQCPLAECPLAEPHSNAGARNARFPARTIAPSWLPVCPQPKLIPCDTRSAEVEPDGLQHGVVAVRPQGGEREHPGGLYVLQRLVGHLEPRHGKEGVLDHVCLKAHATARWPAQRALG